MIDPSGGKNYRRSRISKNFGLYFYSSEKKAMKIYQLLAKMLGQKLHLDLPYFIKNSTFAFIQQTIGVTCGLIVSYIFGHFISVQTFGEYSLVLSLLGLLNFLGLSEIDTPLTQSVSRGYDGSLITTARIKFGLSLIGIPILLGFAVFYYLRNQTSIAIILVFITLLLPLLNTFTSYPAFLVAKRKFMSLSLLGILSSLFFVITITAASWITKSSLGITIAYLVAITVPAIVGYAYCIKSVAKNFKIDPKLFQYGKFLTLLSILPWISGNIGSILLGTFIGPEALAIYAVASRFLTAVQKNFVVFYKPVTAKLAGQSSSAHQEVLRKHAIKLLLIGLMLMAGLWLLLPLLVRFFFTDKYTSAIVYGRYLSLTLIVLPFNWVVSDMMLYQKKTHALIARSTIPHIIKIAMYLIVVPMYKIDGLVAITLLDRFTEPIIPFLSLTKTRIKFKRS